LMAAERARQYVGQIENAYIRKWLHNAFVQAYLRVKESIVADSIPSREKS